METNEPLPAKALYNVRRGMGVLTVLRGPLRLQLYWPHVYWTLPTQTSGHLSVNADNKLRIMWSRSSKHFGAGFQFFGFGIGGDYETPG